MSRDDSPRLGDDAFAELFAPLREADAPSEAYLADLEESLRGEFLASYGARNGHASVSIAGLQEAEEPIADETPEARAARFPSRRVRRWGLRAALVAGVLAALNVVWGTPEYSWALMLEALADAPWVQVEADGDGPQRPQGWWSRQHIVVAVRRGESAVYHDRRGLQSWDPPTGANAIVTQDLAADAADPGQQLLRLLARVAGTQRLDDGADFPYEVVNQSWRRANSGEVELTVVFRIGGQTPRELHVTFLLDAETGLPRGAATVQDSQAAAPASVQISYVATGPESIYELGVPAGAPIVAAAELPATPRAQSAVADSLANDPAADLRLANSAAPAPDAPDAHPPQPRAAQSVDEMAARVDAILAEHWQSLGVQPVVEASDEEFVRRAYLDIAGRIPTLREIGSFLGETHPDKRGRLVDRLLDAYDSASHLANVWRAFLLGDVSMVSAAEVSSFESWLTERFRRNQPYDQLVSDLLLAEGRLQEGGPLVFFSARKLQPEELARQTARSFLGVRMDCAQCHDHFFDDRWSQRDFWEYAAFFARISQAKSRMERVSPVLRVADVDRGEVMLPDTDETIAPQFPLAAADAAHGDSLSRRRQLVEWMLAPNNEHFARATVNRVWAALLGRGLVDPVDDFRPDNEPVSAETLDELADYFIATDFDLRRLIATIARTRAYQLSSASDGDARQRLQHFAQMNVKCLTAEQLYDCIVVATRTGGGTDSVGRQRDARRVAFVEAFNSAAESATTYEAGAAQALTLMNGALIESATGAETSGLLQALQAPFFTDDQRVETLFLATVSRRPTESEKTAVLDLLAGVENPAENVQVLSDVLWALVNSAEFTLIP